MPSGGCSGRSSVKPVTFLPLNGTRTASNLKRIFHLFRNAIVEGLGDGKADGHFNNIVHGFQIIFFSRVCQICTFQDHPLQQASRKL